MTTWNPEANDLFLKVVELGSPEERRAFVDQACGDNPELRAQVEALLSASERAGSFLEKPALAVADRPEPRSSRSANEEGRADQRDGASSPEPLREGPGARIGPYKLLQQIGEGGMGVVYLAEQEQPVRRQVALKIIKPGLDGTQVIARFEAERQALALMEHQHIARVLEAGTTASGRPFFVMELVKGVPLTRYCDEARLSVRRRLELFLPICQAVQHAHQKGIIHRDLKPSNLLVALYDGQPVPKVIDFGVAKATGPKLTERTLFTAFGTMVGTLEYMAPEQAELNQLDVDTRSDIYSLGVILYELLTGTTPLERQLLQEAALAEMLRLIQEEEPPKPSTRLSQSQTLPSVATARQVESRRLCQLVQGDLDWIVMKALAKERHRRYGTADDLARDLERYLHEEPVLAGPPGAGYRLRKFIRRHRGTVAASVAMLVLLLVGVVASTWQAVRATRAEQTARSALQQVVTEQQRTEAALAAETAARAQARQALDTLTDDVVQTLFAKQPVLGEAEKAFLRKVLAFYEAFTQQLGETAEARALQARGYFKVALLRQRLGEPDEAESACRQSLAILEKLVAEFPEATEYNGDLASSHNGLGTVLEYLGRRAEAEAAYRQAIGLYEKLAAEFPGEPAYRRDLAGSQSNLGNLLREMGKRAEAATVHPQALTVQKKLVEEYPGVPVYRRHLAINYNNWGNLLGDLGKWSEAEAAYRAALDLHAKLAEEFASVPAYRGDLARTQANLAHLLGELGKLAKAELFCRQALGLYEKLATEFPAVPAYRRLLARTHNSLGDMLWELGKSAEAEAAYRRSLELHEKLAAKFPAVPEHRRDVAATRRNLGNALRGLGRFAETEAAFRQALATEENLAAEFPTEPRYRQRLALTFSDLGNLLRRTSKLAEAEAAYREALHLRQELANQFPTIPDHRRELAISLGNLGALLRELGKLADAETAYRRALDLYEKLAVEFPDVPQYRAELGVCYHGLGWLLEQLDKLAETERAYRQSLDHFGKLADEFPTVPRYRVRLASALISVGDLLRKQQGRPADALPRYDRAIALLEPLNVQEPRDVPIREALFDAHWGRAVALADLKRHAEALINWDQALELSSPAARARTQLARARSRLFIGRVAEAVADAEALTQDHATPGDMLYNAACVHALAAAASQNDAEQREAHAGRALALLRRAQGAGFFKEHQRVDHVKKDADIDALRPRDDFQKLLAELEAAAASRCSEVLWPSSRRGR